MSYAHGSLEAMLRDIGCPDVLTFTLLPRGCLPAKKAPDAAGLLDTGAPARTVEFEAVTVLAEAG